jgi:error-prone DNA polymerase
LFVGRLWLAVELHHGPNDERRFEALRALAESLGLPMVATGDVHMHVRRRRALQDVMTATRYHRTVAEAGDLLFPNGERHLRIREALSAIYPAELMAESVRIAERCHFVMADLKYRYPAELVPAGYTPTTWLRQLTEEGVRWRWPQGEPIKVREQIEHELALVEKLEYESYFLTVQEIVAFARGEGILCQGAWVGGEFSGLLRTWRDRGGSRHDHIAGRAFHLR